MADKLIICVSQHQVFEKWGVNNENSNLKD